LEPSESNGGNKTIISKNPTFARYSRNLCWIVAAIWLVLSILAFTGNSEASAVNGFLWLVGAIAFAASALYLSKSGSPAP